MLREALQALEANRPEDAAGRLREQIEQDGENALLHAALGMVLAQMGDADGALAVLERAHYLQPQNAQVLFHYGLALETAGRRAEARLRFEAASRIDPTYLPARQRLEAAPTPDTQAPPTAAITPSRPQSSPRERARSHERLPLAELPNRPQVTDVSKWDADQTPGLFALVQAALRLWGQQPLLWILILAVPNLIAAAAIPLGHTAAWVVCLIWSVAFGIGAAPSLLGMAGQWMDNRPFGGEARLTRDRWLYGTALCLAYALLFIAPPAILLSMRLNLAPSILVLAAFVLTLPFHALAAPALMTVVTGQAAPGAALHDALKHASRRTWLHLGVIAILSILGGGLLAVFAWAFLETLRGGGAIVNRVMETAGLSLGQTVWSVCVTVCGLDALSTRPPSPLDSDADAEDEEYPEMPPESSELGVTPRPTWRAAVAGRDNPDVAARA